MYYLTNTVSLFLAQSYPYAARCFAEANTTNEITDSLSTERWFRSYFPSGTSRDLHEKMEIWILNHYLEIN